MKNLHLVLGLMTGVIPNDEFEYYLALTDSPIQIPIKAGGIVRKRPGSEGCNIVFGWTRPEFRPRGIDDTWDFDNRQCWRRL